MSLKLKRKKYTFLLKDVWDLEHDVQNKSNFKKKVIEEIIVIHFDY